MNPEQSNTISQVGGNTAQEPVSKTTQTSPPLTTGYNMRCPAVKRLMREAAELANPDDDYAAHPTESNLFEWHFTIRGPEESDFENGVYHGRIIFPSEYPMKPPSFILLTPNGRFQTEEKICLSISNYHPETWLPSWSIRTALVALRSFMSTPGNEGAIGSLNFAPEERRKLANKSRAWECQECGPILKLLPAKKQSEPKANGSANSGNGDASQFQQQTVSTNSAFQATEIPTNEMKQRKRVTADTISATKEEPEKTKEKTTDEASAPAVTGDETNAAPRDLDADPGTEEHHSQSTRLQPNESVKNILYDFGIGCFVILILALCLRRLVGIIGPKL